GGPTSKSAGRLNFVSQALTDAAAEGVGREAVLRAAWELTEQPLHGGMSAVPGKAVRGACPRADPVPWRDRRMRLLLVLAALIVALPSGAVTIDWVTVGNPGNAADTPAANCFAASCGSVPGAYDIGKYELTNAEYAEFLNAKATSDPFALYD